MVAQSYYLPCTCGKSTVVDAGLAGTTVTCQCGNTLQVPKFRELRLLESVAQAEPTVQYSASAARSLGCLFGSLLAIALVAAIVTAGAWYLRSRVDVSWSVEKDLAEGNRQIDRMSVDQAYEIWKNFADSGLGSPQPPAYIRNIQMANQLKHAAIYSGVLLVVCLGAAGVVAVIDAQRARE